MIYNFVEYLMTEFPAETFFVNTRTPIAGAETIPDRNTLIRETGGPETPWFGYVQKSLQILTRDKSTPLVRKLAWDIYEKIQSVFGLILPAVTVGGTIYPAIQVAQISSIQQPYCLGDDGEGRMEFTENFKCIYRRE